MIEEAHCEKIESIILKRITPEPVDPLAPITFKWNTVRSVGERLSDLDLDEAAGSKLYEYQKVLSRQIDKMLFNSVFGKGKGSSAMPAMPIPVYSARRIDMDGEDYPHRVKLRCTNYETDLKGRFESESHACERHAAKVVWPWIKDNCAHDRLQMSYSVFAFTDPTDADLCYMRFR
jgi:hypothetical protein